MTAGHMENQNDWHWQMAHRVHSIETLRKRFSPEHERLSALNKVSKKLSWAVTPYYLSLIQAKGWDDPIGRQCLPDVQEINDKHGEDDPLQEAMSMPVPGLIHRYPDRCLVLATRVCAVYCRHCNRRHLWGKKPQSLSMRAWQGILSYIRQNQEIREVILSGGDPLTMADDILDRMLGDIRDIPHVEILRIGSRMPVVMPMRITRDLCTILGRHRPLWLNTQFNHPLEITPQSTRACEMILQKAIPVSSQTVLLRGVNDSFEILRELFYGLQRISVRPYYLFHCDPVRGADHFRTEIEDGLSIMNHLWKSCSGLCLPRYIIDRPEGKMLLDHSSEGKKGGLMDYPGARLKPDNWIHRSHTG